LSDDDRLIDLSQTAWERARNNIRSQQVRDQATNGVNQQGQQLLRQFNVRPTLTQNEGFPVTVSFPQNVSFQTVPIIASK
jgi:type IV secretory pathway VirB10-like protein